MAAKKKTRSPRASKADNLHVILGTDDGAVAESALALVRKLTPEGADDFANDIIEGQADNAEHAASLIYQGVQALQTLPFFGGGKVVWFKAVNFLADTQTGRAEQTIKALETLSSVLKEGFPPDVHFVLSASAVDKRRSFFLDLKKLARIEIFDKPDAGSDGWEERVMGIVLDRARPLGLQFPTDVLQAFVMLVGEDTRQINSELEKLDIYLGEERSVNIEALRAVVTSSRAGVIWEISNAIDRRNLPEALRVLDHHLKRGENAIGLLLAAIVPRVRSLFLAKDLMERFRIVPRGNFRAYEAEINRLPAPQTAHLPRKKDGSASCYPLFLTAGAAQAYSAQHLQNALEACLEANRQLVQTALDHRLVLSQLLIRILS